MTGEEVLAVWSEAFRLLGVDDLDDPDYDRDFAERVEEEVKEMEKKRMKMKRKRRRRRKI